MQVSNDPTIFSAETNPYKRLNEKKKNRLFDILDKLSSAADAGGFNEEEDLSSFLRTPRAQKGGAPAYDPNKYYGGIYSMYGGRKVRGGLLGD